jgi:hypothetical protein
LTKNTLTSASLIVDQLLKKYKVDWQYNRLN